MNFHIITLFPKAFDSYLNESIISRAIGNKPRRQKGSGSRPKASGKIKVNFYNPRDYVENKWTKSAKGGSSDQRSWFRKRVDQKPYSGGPGMVIQALPTIKAVERAIMKARKNRKAKIKIVFFSPGGKQFTTGYAKTTAKKFTDIILVCGRYEGIDARVKKVFKMEEISVGPYVLTGGELPAMVFLDCISRQVKGILGNFSSLEESRVSSHDVYTRPEVFTYKGKKYRVPKVLLSGDHKKIEDWKLRSK